MKFLWKILIGVTALVAMIALVAVVHHFQLKAAVNRYRAELKAHGAPLELAQVVPRPVPPAQNAAPLFMEAAALLMNDDDVLSTNPPPAMRGVAPGKAMVGWTQPEVRSSYATNSWLEVQAALEHDRSALALLFQITNSARFDFGLHYDQRFDMLLTHLSLEKKTSQRLAAFALLDLRSGHPDAAVRNLRTLLALVNGTQEERTAISQLVRIAIAQIGVGVTWELLQSPNLNDQHLADLQADWSRLDFILAAENVLPVEREGDETTAAKWRSSNGELNHYFELQKKARANLDMAEEEDSFWRTATMKMKIIGWRYWWSYEDELRYLKGCDVLLNSLRQARTHGAFQKALATQDERLEELGITKLRNSVDAIFSSTVDFHALQSESVVTLAGVVRKVMRVEAAKQTAVAALALKRYQLKHGNYPADLNELVPEFVSQVPPDPVDGQPLRYHRNTDGRFRLYSVGENGQDDGGDPALEKSATSSSFIWQNPQTRDWVWPQPATDAEVQSFFDHPPK